MNGLTAIEQNRVVELYIQRTLIEPKHGARIIAGAYGSQNGHRPQKRTMPDMRAFNADIH